MADVSGGTPPPSGDNRSLQDDRAWSGLTGGYRTPLDPRPLLRRIEEEWADEETWSLLWNELHHQGDIGTASYASIIALASIAQQRPSRGWRLYGLAALVETERHAPANPDLPQSMVGAYRDSWSSLRQMALRDLGTSLDAYSIRSALAVVALSAGEVRLGAHLTTLDDSELDEALENHLGWPERYVESRGLF